MTPKMRREIQAGFLAAAAQAEAYHAAQASKVTRTRILEIRQNLIQLSNQLKAANISSEPQDELITICDLALRVTR